MIVPMLATPFRCAVVQISEGPAVYVSQVRLLLFGDWSEFWEACSEDEEVVNLKELIIDRAFELTARRHVFAGGLRGRPMGLPIALS